jgi:ferric-dicitrate binding protein FerR (iron transport regulator)
MIPPDDRDDTVRNLLRQPRPADVDAVWAARVRREVHAAWQDATGSVGIWRRRATFGVAAILVAAITLTLVSWRRDRGVPHATDPIASTLFATGEVVFQHDSAVRTGRVGDLLMPGTGITTNGGRGAILLANGVELRLDSETAITVDTARRVSLMRGAIYLDSSNRKGPPEPVEVVAGGTVVRDIGTRYEVRLSDRELRVRVRDGRVHVTSAFGTREADRGGLLRVTPSGILAGRTPTSGADWDWIVRAVRPPQLEGRPLMEFLTWAEREGGRPIRFADPALERANASIVYGAIERLTVDEALDVVLASCGLARRHDGDAIIVVAADDPNGAR